MFGKKIIVNRLFRRLLIYFCQMKIQNNFPLKNYNSFGIDAYADKFVAVQTLDELKSILTASKNETKFILGGGSNMLLTKDIEALVIHIDLKGKKNNQPK